MISYLFFFFSGAEKKKKKYEIKKYILRGGAGWDAAEAGLNTKPAQVWRTDGLIRLYAGYLLFVLSDAMNPVKRTFSFEHWYIVYFHDIRLWERKHRTGGPSDSSVYSNLVATTRRIARSSLGSTMSSHSSNDSQVIEVIERVVEMAQVTAVISQVAQHGIIEPLTASAQEYWFLLDQHSLSLAQLPRVRGLDTTALDKIRAFVRWLPMNPELNSIGRLLINKV